MHYILSILTLRTKLVFLFLALTLVPLIAIGFFSIRNTERLIKSLVLRQLENIGADKGAILERWLEERKQDLQVIAGTSIVQSMDATAIAPYLSLIQKHYGVYKNLTILSASDQVIVSTSTTHDFAGSTSWEEIGGPESPVLTKIIYLDEERESIFQIAAPIFNSGARIGTVLGTVGTNNIIYTILSVSLGQTGECYLVDSDGAFLAHKEPERILSENISQSDSFKNIFGTRDRSRTYLDYRGIEVLGFSQKIGGTDWYLVVEQDRAEAFQDLEKLKKYIYLTLLLASSSTFVLIWVISHHIVGPIRTLSRSAHTLANTDHDPIATDLVGTRRGDEIGILCRAFANMALKIRERQDSLEQQCNLKEAELEKTGHTLKQFKLIAERSEKFAALGRLGAAVAHEIRTPLTSLKLFLESVETEIEISPEYAQDFMVAMGQIARIETAINRLLDFTKPKDLFFSKIDTAGLIHDVVSIIKPLANKQECVLQMDLREPLPGIAADKKLLEEALINLLINALEASQRGGHIAVTAMADTLRIADETKPCVRIDIQDSGAGIPEEHLDVIFDPFFTTKPTGSGLGLPMVLNTIKRHEGEIRVRSRLNEGTLFSLFLPITPKMPETYGRDTADR